MCKCTKKVVHFHGGGCAFAHGLLCIHTCILVHLHMFLCNCTAKRCICTILWCNFPQTICAYAPAGRCNCTLLSVHFGCICTCIAPRLHHQLLWYAMSMPCLDLLRTQTACDNLESYVDHCTQLIPKSMSSVGCDRPQWAMNH